MPIISSPPPRRALRTEQLFFALRLPREAELAPDDRHLAYVELRPEEQHFGKTVRVLALDADGGAKEIAAFPGTSPRWSPDGRTLAFVVPASAEGSQASIRVHALETGETRPLPETAGASDLAWSPDGARIAYSAVPPDERDPAAPIVVRGAGFRVNGAGLPPRLPALFVVELADGSARRLGDFDGHAVRSFAWAPDGARIAVAAGLHLHEPSHVHLVALDGEQRRLGPEDGEAVTVTWTPDGRLLVAGKPEAERVGHTQLLLRDPDGAAPDVRVGADLDLEPELADALWPGSLGPVVTPDGAHALFCVTDRGRVDVVRAALDGGASERVLHGETAAYYGLSVGRELLATVFTNAHNPGDVVVARLDGSDARTLTDANGALVADAGIVVPEERWFTAPDGTRVHGFLLRPADVEGPLPLVLDVHGGPHCAWYNSFRDVEAYNHELVARGIAVLLLNPRGSVGYGEEFYRGVCESWGEADFQDFTCALDALVEEGLAEPDRLVVTGYSYGGFTTNNLIGRTDRFATAVSFAGVTDFASMFGATAPGTGLIRAELGGLPTERQELYDQLSPLRRAANITTPVLFVHPLDDQTAPPSQSETLYTMLAARGLDTELVLYPGTHHLGSEWPFPARLDSWRRTLDWILDHIGMEDVD